MEWVAVVAGLLLLEYMGFSILVGKARGKYGVGAPATTGHEIFERYYRVQSNTLETLVVVLPGLWLCARFASEPAAVGLGLLYFVGRAVYLRSYVADPSSRGTGFLMTFAAMVLLVLAGTIGALMEALAA